MCSYSALCIHHFYAIIANFHGFSCDSLQFINQIYPRFQFAFQTPVQYRVMYNVQRLSFQSEKYLSQLRKYFYFFQHMTGNNKVSFFRKRRIYYLHIFTSYVNDVNKNALSRLSAVILYVTNEILLH